MNLKLREVQANGIRLCVREWGERGAPQVVLIPGTGLAAALFAGVERVLAPAWHGFTIDRRGQGMSGKPDAGYDFQDFADDLLALVESLDIHDAIAIGHSAGGTDLLLAAGADSTRWRRLAVLEPTVQDPRHPPLPQTDPPVGQDVFERTIRRRDTYPSFEAAYERFRASPLYSRAPEAALRTYLREAFVLQKDSSVSLRCPPQIEAQMLRPIVQAMEHRYHPPDGRGDPFEQIRAIRLPATIVTTGLSDDIYRKMASIATALIPGAATLHFADAGHLLPLDHPERVAALTGEPGT